MDKKLESRQDLLSRWVEKGAVLHGLKLHNVEGIYGTQAIFSNEAKRARNCFCIYEILYSPESNFFEVMFHKKDWIDFRWVMLKQGCVTSQDPLQYLKANLNETTSF